MMQKQQNSDRGRKNYTIGIRNKTKLIKTEIEVLNQPKQNKCRIQLVDF